MYILNFSINTKAYDISSILSQNEINSYLLNNKITNEKSDNNISEIKDISDYKLPNWSSNEKCLKRPETGKGSRVFNINDKIDVIDEKDSFVILNYDNKLYWCNLRNLNKSDGIYKIKEKIVLREVKELCIYKENQMLDINEKCNGYLKIKTSDGYYGWINSKFSKNINGIYYVSKEAKVYYTADLAQMDSVKNLGPRDTLRKIDERNGYYLVDVDGKMSWCNKNDVELAHENTHTLSVNKEMQLYEAGYHYVYKKSEKINVVDGSNSKAIKVKLPDNSFAWVLREDVSYDKDKNLIASRDVKAYYTGNKDDENINGYRENIANIACREEGYTEGQGNRTKYGDWYGINAEWCAIFVSWCANKAGINEDIIPKHSYCLDGANWFIEHKCWYSPNEYIPKKGDITYFYQGNGINHVGVVVKVTNDSIITMEGNMSNKVLKMSHKLNDDSIAGYGVPIFE